MSTSLRPGEHTLSAAVRVATRKASETGKLPRLKVIARELGITREELRTAVPSRADLLNAMAETALQRLLHMVTERVTSPFHDSPVEQFQAVAEAYVDWAGLYPYEFRFIGEMPAGQFTANPRLLQYEKPIHALVAKILHRAKAEGFLGPDEDPETLVMMSHTYVYGVITKMLLGDLSRWSPGLSNQETARMAIRLFVDKCCRPSSRREAAS